jgi:hypothetical protein
MSTSRLLVPLAATALLFAAACSDSTTDPTLRAPTRAAYDQGGNSDAAHACQQGGYESLFRDDGSGFDSVGDCVEYAAHGGTFAQRVRFSNIELGGCNANTFGYEAGGVQHDLLSKGYACNAFFTTMPDQTVGVPLGQNARVYLRDNTCQETFFEDEPHGIVTGTNPFFVKIGDGGGFCELPPSLNIWDHDVGRDGNLMVTKTIL